MANNISCDAHDYFEIVCMRRSLIKVTTKDNKIYHGIATDIKLFEKQEYLHISDGLKTQRMLLSEVKTLEALGNQIDQHNFSFTNEYEPLGK
ncbi:MAG: Rho-binding antiterminator [Colwellia sp.]|nr:Rho-binding antiterminator [Colwellia sp.]